MYGCGDGLWVGACMPLCLPINFPQLHTNRKMTHIKSFYLPLTGCLLLSALHDHNEQPTYIQLNHGENLHLCISRWRQHHPPRSTYRHRQWHDCQGKSHRPRPPRCIHRARKDCTHAILLLPLLRLGNG